MIALLFFAALLGGALNSVAGGGSFITLPALLWWGVPPVAANATSTFALWPGSVSSAWAYRREVAATDRGSLVRLIVVSLAGGLLGARLLISTSDTSFMRLLPWLMLLAAATFTWGGRVTARLWGPRSNGIGTDGAGTAGGSKALVPWALLIQLAIATYGGYFGGGMGIMMLTTLAVAGMTDIHKMNGLKTVLATAINAVALGEFAARGAIAWAPGVVMVAGGVIGGYTGAAVARRVEGRVVRLFVIAVAWTMTAYFFVRVLT